MGQLLLTEAARRLGISRLTLWRAIREGEIKKIKRVARYTFVDENEVMRWYQKWLQQPRRRRRVKKKSARASSLNARANPPSEVMQ